MSRCPWPGPVVPTRQVQLQRAMALLIPPGRNFSLIPPGYLSRHFTRILQPPFHLDTSDAIPLGRHPIFFGCLTAAIPPDRHPIFFGCLTTAIPPGYLSRHSTRMPQPPFHPVNIPFSLDVSQPPFYPTDVPPSPDISHPAPDAGWERRTIQLPIELTNQDVFLS